MTIILILIMLIIVIAIMALNSNIQIEIKNLKISTLKPKGEKINKNYEIIVSIVFFKYIKLIRIKITNEKIRKAKNSKKIVKTLETIDVDSIKKKIDIRFITLLRKVIIKIKKLELNLEIGIEDAALTALSVGVISTILSILLTDKLENNKCKTNLKLNTKKIIENKRNKFENKFKYVIKPIYAQRNLLKLELNCIIQINLKHYIYNVIFKERGNENERTSNRRSYAYSNE